MYFPSEPAVSDISNEDQARADHYALLSRLFYAPPDAPLLTRLAAASSALRQGALAAAWNDLCQAATEFTVAAMQEEYAALFIGVGKPLVVLYASWHLTGFMMEQPLVRLRSDLASFGLARNADVAEPEDHIAALMDVMRHLILAPERAEAARLELQHQFFFAHISLWHEDLWSAIEKQEEARFYRKVSEFARRFLDLEEELLKTLFSAE